MEARDDGSEWYGVKGKGELEVKLNPTNTGSATCASPPFHVEIHKPVEGALSLRKSSTFKLSTASQFRTPLTARRTLQTLDIPMTRFNPWRTLKKRGKRQFKDVRSFQLFTRRPILWGCPVPYSNLVHQVEEATTLGDLNVQLVVK